ncbi:hypothetical protein YC2023_064035 [Brassica napus]
MCSRLNISTSEILYLWIQIFSCSNVLDRAALHGSGFEYCWLLSYEQEVRLELSGVPKNIGDHISQLFPLGREALILFFQSKQFIDSLDRNPEMQVCVSKHDKSFEHLTTAWIQDLEVKFLQNMGMRYSPVYMYPNRPTKSN